MHQWTGWWTCRLFENQLALALFLWSFMHLILFSLVKIYQSRIQCDSGCYSSRYSSSIPGSLFQSTKLVSSGSVLPQCLVLHILSHSAMQHCLRCIWTSWGSGNPRGSQDQSKGVVRWLGKREQQDNIFLTHFPRIFALFIVNYCMLFPQASESYTISCLSFNG